VCLGVSSNHN